MIAINDVIRARSSTGPAGERARTLLTRRASRARNLLTSCDATYIIGSFAMRVISGPDTIDWYGTHGLDTMIQYGIGLAFEGEPKKGRSRPDADTIQECYELISRYSHLNGLLVSSELTSHAWTLTWRLLRVSCDQRLCWTVGRVTFAI